MSKLTRRRRGEFQTPVEPTGATEEALEEAQRESRLAEAAKARPHAFHEHEVRQDGGVKVRAQAPGRQGAGRGAQLQGAGRGAQQQGAAPGQDADLWKDGDSDGGNDGGGGDHGSFVLPPGPSMPYEASNAPPPGAGPRAERRGHFVTQTKEALPGDLATLLEALGRQQQRCATPLCEGRPTICCAACSPVLGWCDRCDADRHEPAQLLHRRVRLATGDLVIVGPVRDLRGSDRDAPLDAMAWALQAAFAADSRVGPACTEPSRALTTWTCPCCGTPQIRPRMPKCACGMAAKDWMMVSETPLIIVGLHGTRHSVHGDALLRL